VIVITPHAKFLEPRRAIVAGALAVILLLGACHRQPPAGAPPPAPKPAPTRPAPVAITSGATLVSAMRDRYPSWYRTLTFVQKTTLYRPNGGEIVQTWYEAASLPGRLRIDTDLAAKSGTLFAHDSIFAISGGKLVRADTGLNELLVLGFDVYTQSAARTEAQLRRLGFDLSRFHEGSWQGRPVYIVGAARGDTLSKQFWVDRENLLFVRLLERGPRGRVDLRFDRYERLGQGWIAMEVLQLVNGKPTLREEYTDPRADVPLPDALFDPRKWTATHWARPSRSRDF
jgi:hypothetical protein